LGCRWCLADSRCHEMGSLYNPCSDAKSVTDPSSCPAPLPPRTAFNLNTSYDMLMYTKAVYHDDPAAEVLPAGFQLALTFNFSLGPWERAVGFLGSCPPSRQIVVAFRGTDTLPQLTDEILHHTLVPYPNYERALVNEYFLIAVATLEPIVGPQLAELLRACPDCTLATTGHSLGGAMAMLFAVRAREKLPKRPMAVYTFGQPRVGDHNLTQLVDKLLPGSLFRIVNAADLIPHVPLCSPFRIPCHQDASGYYHAGTEIWFPYGDYSGGVMCGYRECLGEPLSEDPSCSDGLFSMGYPPSILDHHRYFEVVPRGFCGGAPKPRLAVLI